MTTQPDTWASLDDYFRQDSASPTKLEYYAGVIVAQAGSTARHNLIVTNIIGNLYAQLRHQGCRMFPSDMRVCAVEQAVYTYPDITIVCGIPHYSDLKEMTLLNPTVIIEILSPTTEARDRTEKLAYYRQIDTLAEYVLIAQDTPYVQHYSRQTSHLWYVHLIDTLEEQIVLTSANVTLALRDIYDGIFT